MTKKHTTLYEYLHQTGVLESKDEELIKKVNQEALKYLKQGLKAKEVAKLTDLHINTITKIKKLGITPKKVVGSPDKKLVAV
jgi:transposase